MMLLKCCIQNVSKFGKPSSGHKTGKGQFPLHSQKREMPKNVQTTIQLHSFQMLAMLWTKAVKIGFSNMWTVLLDIQAGFWRGREIRNQIANIYWKVGKASDFQKKSTSASLTTLKPLTMWITTNCGKFFKRWEY